MLTFAAALLIFQSASTARPVQLVGTPIAFRPVTVPLGCWRALPKLRRVCKARRLGSKYHMEVAFADFDRDGLEDVAVRFDSFADCGNHGCATDIYRALRGGVFRKPRGDDNAPSLELVTYRRIARRQIAQRPGVAFPDGGPGFVCFPFR